MHVLQRLHFFQFFNFFIIYTTYRKKKLHAPTAKKNSIFFYDLHDLPQKKITRIYRKKNYTTRRFFLYTTYIFHSGAVHSPLASPWHGTSDVHSVYKLCKMSANYAQCLRIMLG